MTPEHREHLIRDHTGATGHVEPAVAQRHLVPEGVLVGAVHVAKASDAVVALLAVQLDEQLEPLVEHVPDVRQPAPGALPVAAGKAVGPLDIAEITEL